MSAFEGNPDRHLLHLLLTHVYEDNVTRSPGGHWSIYGNHCPPAVSRLLEQLHSDGLIAVRRDWTVFLSVDKGLDKLIEMNDEAGLPQ